MLPDSAMHNTNDRIESFSVLRRNFQGDFHGEIYGRRCRLWSDHSSLWFLSSWCYSEWATSWYFGCCDVGRDLPNVWRALHNICKEGFLNVQESSDSADPWSSWWCNLWLLVEWNWGFSEACFRNCPGYFWRYPGLSFRKNARVHWTFPWSFFDARFGSIRLCSCIVFHHAFVEVLWWRSYKADNWASGSNNRPNRNR